MSVLLRCPSKGTVLSVKGDHRRTRKAPRHRVREELYDKGASNQTAAYTCAKHTSYAARLLRRTMGATPQPGGPGTRRL
jgi:hypothetical protein